MFGKDARLGLWLSPFFLFAALGAKHATPNFDVEAPTAAIAEKVALTAERCREELAIEWLGHSLPNWSARCKVRVRVGQMGAGGATTFSFANGHVFGWDMTVQGSLERILDSVIPHEVSHTIFACHFRRPLPRWADEGAATLAEENSERRRQQKLAEEMMPSSRRIPLRELLQIAEYPKNMQHVLTLYAEGYSLADFLVQRGGKAKFLAFMQASFDRGWDAAFRQHYDEPNIEALETKWSRWVAAGSPTLKLGDGVLLASARDAKTSATKALSVRESTATDAAAVVRSQTPDRSTSRGQGRSAPEPRRSNPSADVAPALIAVGDDPDPPSPFAMVRSETNPLPRGELDFDIEPAPLEPRRQRPLYLSLPELRRGSSQR